VPLSLALEVHMNVVLKISIWFFMVAVGAVTLLIVTSLLHKEGLLGHSDFFDFLDADLDNELVYAEWMNNYSTAQHQHPIENCMRSDFYHADCNQDDRLTWKEYHNFRFKSKRCASSAVPTLSQWYKLAAQSKKAAGSLNYALSTVPMGEAHNAIYRKYISTIMARESELKKRYRVE
jgi:hypothetical protein